MKSYSVEMLLCMPLLIVNIIISIIISIISIISVSIIIINIYWNNKSTYTCTSISFFAKTCELTLKTVHRKMLKLISLLSTSSISSWSVTCWILLPTIHVNPSWLLSKFDLLSSLSTCLLTGMGVVISQWPHWCAQDLFWILGQFSQDLGPPGH